MLRFIVFSFFFVVVQSSIWAADYKPILNVLAPMNFLTRELMAQFEVNKNVHVRIEFVGSRTEYESRLRSGLRNYDVVIADERILQRLFLQRQLRSISDEKLASVSKQFPLQQSSKINFDGRAYVPLLADPMGIAYIRKSAQAKSSHVSWEWLISVDDNPLWRQRVFVSNNPKQQLLLALLATNKEISSTSWYIPDATLKWLQNLKLQSLKIDSPLEMAFLDNKIEAAVVFLSNYYRLKKVVFDLKFAVPKQSTYYDRIGVGIVAGSVQENLSLSFIRFLKLKSDFFAKKDRFISLKNTNYEGSICKNWVLYDDDFPFPKKIENILNDFYKNKS